jgi:hypothetical protein
MGIFDKKSSSNANTSASQTTPSAVGDASTALGFGNLSTGKNSSINLHATMTDYGAIEAGAGVTREALEYAAHAGDTAAALAYDGVSKALNFAADVSSDNTALTGRVLDKQTAANIEFLGQVSNFSELSAQTAREQAELSERQAADAMKLVQKANADALAMGGKFAQDAQNASMKALDYVFESTKSETARLSEISMKWIVGAAVLLAAIPILARLK